MKQEKNQTVCFDIETTAWPTLEPWQKDVLNKTDGLKKGQLFVVSAGRGTGKSQMAAMYMATHFEGGTAIFGSPWDEWEDIFVWPWDRKTSVESGKKIWGRIKIRKHRAMYGSDGTIAKEYATKQEAFKRKLRGAD